MHEASVSLFLNVDCREDLQRLDVHGEIDEPESDVFGLFLIYSGPERSCFEIASIELHEFQHIDHF